MNLTTLYLGMKYGLVLKKPIYLARSIRNHLVHGLGLKKTPTLRSLCLAITYSCNFSCPHCFTNEMMRKRKDERYLTLENYRRLAKQAMELGAISFAFQGGEIWLRKDYREVIQAFKPSRNYIAVTTNGSFINKKTAKELKSIGVDTVFFSLESAIEEEHDRLIGRKGGYATTMQAIRTTMGHGPRVGINLTLSKANLRSEGVKKLVEFCNKKKILLVIIFARALGSWKEFRSLMLDKEDIKYYNTTFKKMCPFAHRDLVYNYGGKPGCPAGKENFYINPWGDVLACPFNHTRFGNVKEKSLGEIHRNVMRTPWFNHFHPRCLTAEEPAFMDAYYEGISQSKNGLLDYSYWLKKNDKSTADKS